MPTSPLPRASACRLPAQQCHAETGDAINAWQPQGLFDAVVLTGAVCELPERLLAWLKPNGRALVVRGDRRRSRWSC